jgi:hypothetical protein
VKAALAANDEFEMFDGVRDPNLVPVDAGVPQRPIEDFSSRPDERPPSRVLLISGLLAHQHQPGRWRSLAEDGLRRSRTE